MTQPHDPQHEPQMGALAPFLFVLGLFLLPFLAVGVLLLAVVRLIERVSGEGRWYDAQRRRMQDERPPLSDEDFLNAERVPEIDAPVWVAVRCIMADLSGLPPEAIYPDDPLASLWRMQWGVPDLLDLAFRLERHLGVRIPRRALDTLPRSAYQDRTGAFRDLAHAFAEILRPRLAADSSASF